MSAAEIALPFFALSLIAPPTRIRSMSKNAARLRFFASNGCISKGTAP
jgi:hypothetical protein